MCLMTNTSIPTILDKDLVVYKVFYEQNGKIYSPYMNQIYNIRKLYYDEKIEVNTERNKLYAINKAYHSCLTKDSARWHIYVNTARVNSIKYRIYKCVIPKGSKVFFGIGLLSCEEIASDTIIIKRRLWFNRW